MEMKSLKKEIAFDGSKFWLESEVIGEVNDEYKFKEYYDEQFMDCEKTKCLGKIIGDKK